MTNKVSIICGDAADELKKLPAQSVHCCVTSPPYYGLRDYGIKGQIGLETSPEEYVARLSDLFEEVRRVLRDDGTLWLNLGDSYSSGGSGGASPASTLTGGGGRYRKGSKAEAQHVNGFSREIPEGYKPKNLLGVPWRVAFALQAAGWYLRSDIIWAKPNPMPESVTDRPTKAHEYLFLFAKQEKYFYDADAIAEQCEPEAWHKSDFRRDRNRVIHPTVGNGERNARSEKRNKRSVWTVSTHPFAEAHFATFPPDLIRPCVRAGCPVGGTVLDPFGGSGTTGMVALEESRSAILIELNPDYVKIAEARTNVTPGLALA